jgi:hypothetical protein
MSVEEQAPPRIRRHRRKTERPNVRLITQDVVFVADIPLLASQEGRHCPALSSLEKMLSKAGRDAGNGPRVWGFYGRRPVYRPGDVLAWLDSLISREPRKGGIIIPTTKNVAPVPTATSPVPTATSPVPTAADSPVNGALERPPCGSPTAASTEQHADTFESVAAE